MHKSQSQSDGLHLTKMRALAYSFIFLKTEFLRSHFIFPGSATIWQLNSPIAWPTASCTHPMLPCEWDQMESRTCTEDIISPQPDQIPSLIIFFYHFMMFKSIKHYWLIWLPGYLSTVQEVDGWSLLVNRGKEQPVWVSVSCYSQPLAPCCS